MDRAITLNVNLELHFNIPVGSMSLKEYEKFSQNVSDLLETLTSKEPINFEDIDLVFGLSKAEAVIKECTRSVEHAINTEVLDLEAILIIKP